MSESERVIARVRGGVGRLTLNRPEALNALDLDMALAMSAALDAWRDDPEVAVVVLDGAGERGFCAGGDVRGLYRQIVEEDADAAGIFFRHEYALDAAIAEFPKPVVALADGITMGGGIGLAGHAAIRVVTERSRLAMPETRIGFTPDVGGTWLLAHAPGRVGEYLGLTGESMDAADACYAGFADVFVPSDRLDALRRDPRSLSDERSEESKRAEPPSHEDHRVSSRHSGPRSTTGGTPDSGGGESRLAAARAWIDDAFAADTVPEIVERLRHRPEPSAAATADILESLAPTALAVTLAAVRRARGLPDLRAALEQEYGLVMWFCTTQPDLVEGIRAQLVDKDRNPRWQPATLAELAPDLVASAFAFRPGIPLWS
ncbi:MAG: enoyl-CoA hydratase/isomerase family protein [Microbacterium sp.]|uniref:enoyl-CoA hydratase/isomerase family protein n=1 Tax=Microbacterium sp. TaxID=51671 RepID=UPI0039E5F852